MVVGKGEEVVVLQLDERAGELFLDRREEPSSGSEVGKMRG